MISEWDRMWFRRDELTNTRLRRSIFWNRRILSEGRGAFGENLLGEDILVSWWLQGQGEAWGQLGDYRWKAFPHGPLSDMLSFFLKQRKHTDRSNWALSIIGFSKTYNERSPPLTPPPLPPTSPPKKKFIMMATVYSNWQMDKLCVRYLSMQQFLRWNQIVLSQSNFLDWWTEHLLVMMKFLCCHTQRRPSSN